MPSLSLRPGVAVRLKQQPPHISDFVVVACQGDRVWLRQPHWPAPIQLCVNVTKLFIPAAPEVDSLNSARLETARQPWVSVCQ